MPKPRVYVETTIPSAYHTARTDPESVARRLVTRTWWDMAVRSCALVTSEAVLRELARGRSDQVPKRIALLRQLEMVESDDGISATAGVYIQQMLMPQDPEGDALHLALASHHKCDVLATWNYHHLANSTKLHWIRRLNGELGLTVPRIVTPRQLMKETA